MHEFALVCWTIEDVQEVAEKNKIQITDKEAENFLEQYEDSLFEEVIAVGKTLIGRKLSEYLIETKEVR